mgnify:CR=1 FL=1
MDKQNIRIIIDTNLWISFLIGRRLRILLDILDRPEFDLLYCQQLKEECLRVARRPKFQKYFPPSAVKELEEWMELHMEMVILTEIPPRCRDPKDDYLLELAVQGHAIFLVSGDDDLLKMGEVEGCKIMTLKQFVTEVLNN